MNLPASAQAGRLESVFDQLPLGLAVFDRELRLDHFNAGWARFFACYSGTSSERVAAGAQLSDLAAGNAAEWTAGIERALTGETVRQEGLRTENEGSVSYWDAMLSPLAEAGTVTGVLMLVMEATERVQSYQGLEQRVQARTHELATLLEVAHNMASTLELQPLLNLILDQLHAVVPFDGASVLTLEGAELGVVAYRGPIAQAQALSVHFPMASSGANRSVIERRAPVIIGDVRANAALAREFQASAGPALETTYGYIRSWLGVPLLHKERVIGMLSLDHRQAYYYSARQGQLALAFAGQVAVALENARLYQAEQARLAEVERRRTVAEGLRDILNVLNSNRPLDEILRYIVAQAGRLLGTDTGAIYRLDPASGQLSIQASLGLSAEYVEEIKVPLGQGAVGRAVLQRRPVVIDMQDAVIAELAENPKSRRHIQWLTQHFPSMVAVPLVIRDEIYGGIVLYFPESRRLSEEEVELAASFGDQAALAIENARLRDQAQQAAVAAERSRLARDLHDAVTQTLFSASLIADVLPRIWERQPAEGRRRLAELRELTRGVLAEMRTLLLELRPSALTETGLGDLLRQLAEATTGRARVPVKVIIEGQGALPAEIQIALYRIAQEALNNVAKHAGPAEAEVRLSYKAPPGSQHPVDSTASKATSGGSDQLRAEQHRTALRVADVAAPKPGAPGGQHLAAEVELVVSDSGTGFDPAAIGANHLGLGIMRERAEAAGAHLTITSRPGQGTKITVAWSARK